MYCQHCTLSSFSPSAQIKEGVLGLTMFGKYGFVLRYSCLYCTTHVDDLLPTNVKAKRHGCVTFKADISPHCGEIIYLCDIDFFRRALYLTSRLVRLCGLSEKLKRLNVKSWIAMEEPVWQHWHVSSSLVLCRQHCHAV